jgi:hypothetical protein
VAANDGVDVSIRRHLTLGDVPISRTRWWCFLRLTGIWWDRLAYVSKSLCGWWCCYLRFLNEAQLLRVMIIRTSADMDLTLEWSCWLLGGLTQLRRLCYKSGFKSLADVGMAYSLVRFQFWECFFICDLLIIDCGILWQADGALLQRLSWWLWWLIRRLIILKLLLSTEVTVVFWIPSSWVFDGVVLSTCRLL